MSVYNNVTHRLSFTQLHIFPKKQPQLPGKCHVLKTIHLIHNDNNKRTDI